MYAFEGEPSNENSWNCLTAFVIRLPGTVRNLTIEIHGVDNHIIAQILDLGDVDQFAQSMRAWQHLDTLETFKLRLCPQRSGGPKQFYQSTRLSYLTAPAFRALPWSASFDVEIVAMTWDWRSNGDGPRECASYGYLHPCFADKLVQSFTCGGVFR